MVMRTLSIALLLMGFTTLTGGVRARDDCPSSPTRLTDYGTGRVVAAGVEYVSMTGGEITPLGTLNPGDVFRTRPSQYCLDGTRYREVKVPGVENSVYIPEVSEDGIYLVEPAADLAPTATPVFNLPPLATPIPASAEVSVPPVTVIETAVQPANRYATWNWLDGEESPVPDPYSITLPAVYAGDMPAPPVALDAVRYVTDAGLNDGQFALLSQNGFVVVPGGLEQFDAAYRFPRDWDPIEGYSQFVTVDTMLHSLYVIYEGTLALLEQQALYGELADAVAAAYEAAEDQARATAGTPLGRTARGVAVYYGVALILLTTPADTPPEEPSEDEAPPPEVPATEDERITRLPGVIESANKGIMNDARAIADQIIAADGQGRLPFLDNTVEDFSAYALRGSYTEGAASRYFRAMLWLSRVTFRANNDAETQGALLALRALQNSPDAVASWQKIDDTLTFMIGAKDNLGPGEYGALATEIYGELTLEAIADPTLLAVFRDRLSALPAPRINTLILPPDTPAEDIAEAGRGFRFMSQRFTLDADIMQGLIDPNIPGRALPSALDVAAAFGSDTAAQMALESGAFEHPDYIPALSALRQQTSALTADDWQASAYNGWLWALQPLWARNSASYPAMMNTDAWLRRDLQTGLASYTELKHATLLYSAQPGGLGGGGGPLPETYGYVEPNPLVFARIAIVGETLFVGLRERGLIPDDDEDAFGARALRATHEQLRRLARMSSDLARMAQKELNGEALTAQEHYYIQYNYGVALFYLRLNVQQWQSEIKPVGLVADIASSPATGEVLQVGVGAVDYIYVVIPTPAGLQLARGAVYSFYEFPGDAGARLTDDTWRANVAEGNLPPRPLWVSGFYAE